MQVEQPCRGPEHEYANPNLKSRPAVRTELEDRADPAQEDAQDAVREQLRSQEEGDWGGRIAPLGLLRFAPESQAPRAPGVAAPWSPGASRATCCSRTRFRSRAGP